MTELADKIDALAEKARLGSQVSYDGPANNLIVWEDCENRVCFMAHSDGADAERDVSRAALIVELVNARETLTRAVRAEARMREALTLAANRLHRCSVEFPTGSVQFIEYGEWAQEARQALGDNT